MKTTTDNWIQIPAVGQCPATKVDPDNRAEVATIIRRADAYFRLSAKAWEDGNNSGDPVKLEQGNRRERVYARCGEELLQPFGIRCDWPGLYPSFNVNGLTEHTTENAVLSAIGKPSNWLKS